MMIWTDIYYSYHSEEEEYGDGEDTQTRTIYIPDPGQSYFSVDFQKDKVDLAAVAATWPAGAPRWARRALCRPRACQKG
jgi:hypothetical protein